MPHRHATSGFGALDSQIRVMDEPATFALVDVLPPLSQEVLYARYSTCFK